MSSSEGIKPLAENWDWQLEGACRGMDINVFFTPDGERNPSKARREARAKQICAECPVIFECRKYALGAREPYGVWGGLSEGERDTILKKKQVR